MKISIQDTFKKCVLVKEKYNFIFLLPHVARFPSPQLAPTWDKDPLLIRPTTLSLFPKRPLHYSDFFHSIYSRFAGSLPAKLVQQFKALHPHF